MNYHNDEWIMNHVKEHYDEALEHFSADRIIGIFYQGSGNYGLDYEDSDVDTKLIVAPTFKEIAMNQQPVSTTHIRENNEHIDFKDIRLYMQTFRKQNLNFLEILFTPYLIVSEKYREQWNRLIAANELIAHYSPIRSIKSMQGIAKEKYFAMEHHYPSRMDWINKFGYDPKQLHHLLRVKEYLIRYIDGEPYADCLISKDAAHLIEVKKGLYSLAEARQLADSAMKTIDTICNDFIKTCNDNINEDVENILNDVQYNIMKIAVTDELKEG